jgi:hypothetical protein
MGNLPIPLVYLPGGSKFLLAYLSTILNLLRLHTDRDSSKARITHSPMWRENGGAEIDKSAMNASLMPSK